LKRWCACTALAVAEHFLNSLDSAVGLVIFTEPVAQRDVGFRGGMGVDRSLHGSRTGAGFAPRRQRRTQYIPSLPQHIYLRSPDELPLRI